MLAMTAQRSTRLDLFAGAMVSIAVGGASGAAAGFIWGGIGGRIAMRVLFLSSNDLVKGATSDDGFEIGRISGDTIFLLIAMTFVGGIVGGVYGLFRILLRGPLWLVTTAVTVAVGIGAGGGLIVSANGVDFRILEPLWLAVSLFLFLPAVWATTVVLATDRLIRVVAASASHLPDIDERPFGLTGAALGWAGLIAATVFGLLDLLRDLEKLT